jgi:ribose/xylose/arabinose/galactoside ABC-type transport system permease subunit
MGKAPPRRAPLAQAMLLGLAFSIMIGVIDGVFIAYVEVPKISCGLWATTLPLRALRAFRCARSLCCKI